MGGQLTGVDRLGGLAELEDRPGVDREEPPLAWCRLAPGEVEHEHVRVELRIGRPAGLVGDFRAGSAGVMGEAGHGKLRGRVDLLAVDGGPAGGHPLLSSRTVTRTAARWAASSVARSSAVRNGRTAETDLGGERLQSMPGTCAPPRVTNWPVARSRRSACEVFTNRWPVSGWQPAASRSNARRSRCVKPRRANSLPCSSTAALVGVPS